jgi:hypothetical protein
MIESESSCTVLKLRPSTDHLDDNVQVSLLSSIESLLCDSPWRMGTDLSYLSHYEYPVYLFYRPQEQEQQQDVNDRAMSLVCGESEDLFEAMAGVCIRGTVLVVAQTLDFLRRERDVLKGWLLRSQRRQRRFVRRAHEAYLEQTYTRLFYDDCL